MNEKVTFGVGSINKCRLKVQWLKLTIKIVENSFSKGGRSWWDIKQHKRSSRSGRPKDSIKKLPWETSQENNSGVVSFLIKFDVVDLQIHWNQDSRCFLVKIAKLFRAPFLQNKTGQVLLIIAVSIVGKEELRNETVDYDTEINACKFEPEV